MKHQPRHLQTAKARLFPSEGISRRRYFILFTLIFVVMIFVVFGIFFVNGKSFICGTDGWPQHYTALVYYAQWLQSIVTDFFTQGTLNIPTFSFSIGYGSDIVNSLEYYVVGDPLAFLSVFIPTQCMWVFYEFLFIFRFYLAGIAFSLFCFYKENQGVSSGLKEGFSRLAIMIGSFIYVFFGYSFYACSMHPFFANSLIYFPLILIGVEKILDGKRPWMFVTMVFIAAVSNFYFFYIIAVMTALYVIWRLIVRYHWKELKKALLKLAKIAGCAALGVCLSAAILFPVLLFLGGDARSDTGYIYDFFYSIEHYESFLGDFISPINSNDITSAGFAAIDLLVILLLFIQKGHIEYKIAFLVLTVMHLLPVVGHFMNGLSYPANRWTWAWSFLMAYIVVMKWRSLFTLPAKEKWRLILCVTAYLLICVALPESRTVSVCFALAILFLSLAVIFAVSERFGHKWASMALAFCVLVNISGNALFRYSPRNSGYLNSFVNSSDISEKMEDTEATPIKMASEGADGFFRYSGNSTTANGTLYSGLHSTQYYWSLSNGNISRFRLESALSGEVMIHSYKTLDSRTFLSALSNVRYYVQDVNVPFDYSYVDRIDDYTVWENNYFLPFGYTYENYISCDDYDSMTPIEKQEAMLQGCVVDSGVEGGAAEPTFTSITVPFEVEVSDGLTYEDNSINVTKEGATLTLTFDGVDNAETYLYLTGLKYAGYSPRELYSEEDWNKLSVYEKNEVEYKNKNYEEKTSVNINIASQDQENNSSNATLTYQTPKHRFYGGQSDFMVNLGYDNSSRISMTLQFPTTGVYTFDSLEVLCQPMDNYEEQVSALAEDVMENVDFHENSAHATNRVTGSISLDSPKYLLLTIPYTDGWTATVDGEKQELLKANTMYMALYLDAGEHEIELTYQTPGLTIGLVVTAASAVVLAGLIVLGEHRRRIRRSRKDTDMDT